MERFFLGLHDQPAFVEAIVQRVGEIQHGCLLRLLRDYRACLGAIMVSDDLAHVRALLVAPDFLRRHVFPWYRALCTECHRRELPVIFLSDGRLNEVIPDLIACGFDALHPLEANAMDIRTVKRRCGAQLAVLGNIDLAFPLALGTPDDVREAVRALIRDCAPGGGLGVGSGNPVPEYVPYDNWTALREATLEFGAYPMASLRRRARRAWAAALPWQGKRLTGRAQGGRQNGRAPGAPADWGRTGRPLSFVGALHPPWQPCRPWCRRGRTCSPARTGRGARATCAPRGR